MDEKELIAHLRETQDDEDEWGEPVPAPKQAKPRRRLAAMVSIRLSDTELERVQARADELGQSVSSYLRGLALSDLNSSIWHRHRHSGFIEASQSASPTFIINKSTFDTDLLTGTDPLTELVFPTRQ